MRETKTSLSNKNLRAIQTTAIRLLAAALLALSCAAAAFAAGDGFAAAVDYPTGPTPLAVAAGDFNNDGRVDLAVANYGGSNVSLLQGKGDGTFQSAVNFAVGSNPRSVAVGDFNGDGRADLVTANLSDNSVSVLVGKGDGTFQAKVDYAVGTSPYHVAVGDLNNDGRADLAVLNRITNDVSVLLGKGDGTFNAAVSHGGLTQAGVSLALADFNRDGITDFAVASDNGQLTVRLGKGDGTFLPAADFALDHNASAIIAGDFNGDGRADLATAHTTGDKVNFHAGNGDGTFAAAKSYAVGASPRGLAAADFNLDGKPDITASNGNGASLSLLYGNGDGTFQAKQEFGTGATPVSLAVGDFNLDGSPDLAAANSQGAGVSVLIKQSTQQLRGFASVVKYNTQTVSLAIASADYDRDGRADLAIANGLAGNVAVYKGNGDGTFQDAKTFGVGHNPYGLTTADFNRDGKLDVVAVNSVDKNVSVLLGKGDGTFQTAVNYPVNLYSQAVSHGDFNRDGKLDLVICNTNDGKVSVLLGNGDGSFGAPTAYSTGDRPNRVAVGDLNRDGRADVVTANNDSDNVSVLLGKGDGTFQNASNVVTGDYPWDIVIGDFNRDGRADIATSDGNDRAVSVHLGKGDGTFQARVVYSTPHSPMAMTTADFDGDGRADLAAGNGVKLSLLRGNGDGTFKQSVEYQVGPLPQMLAAGDFNRDGKPDVASANYDTGSNLETGIGVLLNIPQSYTISGRITNAADPNNNGLKDVTVTLGGSQSATALTDVNGDYSFSIQTAGGNYTVTPTKAGYTFAPANATFNNLSGNQTANFSGQLATLTISGQLAKTLGGAAANVQVKLTGSSTATATSDSNGAYTFTNLTQGGSYTVTPDATGYTWNPASLTYNNLSASVTDANFNGQAQSYQIVGTVTDANTGQGVQGVTVTMTGTQGGTVTTGSTGSFTFSNLAPGGNYTITPTKADYTFTPASQSFSNLGGNKISDFTARPGKTVEFGAGGYTVSEGEHFRTITVTRSGDASASASVDYRTADGTAQQRTDYTLLIGTLSFAPGETTKALTLLVTEDSLVEGPETLTLRLSNPQGLVLGGQAVTQVTVTDNDSGQGQPNAIDDVANFVRQHYHDFLGREPEPGGFQAWQEILNNCAQGDTRCDRIEVSSAFFRSPEFQERSYFLFRFYSVALGRIPHYAEFMPDVARVMGFLKAQQIETGKVDFVSEFMSRAEFKARYDQMTDPSAYVNGLLNTANVTLAQKQQLIDDLAAGRKSRAEVLRAVVESPEVGARFYNEAFVVMQYFGYLRRDPDILYLEWVKTMNAGGDYRTMINGFLNSAEYRLRFGQ